MIKLFNIYTATPTKFQHLVQVLIINYCPYCIKVVSNKDRDNIAFYNYITPLNCNNCKNTGIHSNKGPSKLLRKLSEIGNTK